MSDTRDDTQALSPLQRATLAVRTLRLKLDRLERERTEPLAVIGIGCRFPGGADGPQRFWRFLRAGGDAVTEWPRDRWDVDRYFDRDPDRAGGIYTRHGAFLDRVDTFDAAFFDISAHEARHLDPQQRLLLEVAWEALEHAGRAAASLRESRTGVFVGIGQNDYARKGLLSGEAARIGPYDGTGNGFCFASGRLSYVLGLQGPNLAIDTACSSSLVALHLACQSLRQRECDLALAGGVQLILSPEVTLFLSRARALSPDGRCRAFDAGANGYGRGEGCGLVVLRRLSDALRDREAILAVVRGSAVNHDGPSSGLTVPNAAAQQRVIREALDRAGLQPDEIDAVEAHGTATALGDPLEIAGLAQVFGERAPHLDRVRLGSVKTNIGHLEAAAGIAGVIKMVLALQHGELPAHLHCHQPSPAVTWDRLPVRVVTRAEAWPRGPRPRRAGVSAFGISGTNAHVVIEEAPPLSTAPPVPGAGVGVLPISARSESALMALIGRYATHLAEHPQVPWLDVCHTAGAGRSHWRERLCVIARDAAAAEGLLRSAARGPATNGIVRGRAAVQPPKVAFVYAGQGVQAAGMGRELFAAEPRFRAVVEQCARAVVGDLDADLLDVLYGSAGARLQEPIYTQLGLYAVSCALTVVWRAWGVEPSAVLGHSVGEYAAAVTAGVFDVDTGARLLARRALRMQEAPGPGVMVSVRGPVARVEAAVAGTAVSVAAYNAPTSTVISGDARAVEGVRARLAAEGLTATPLRVAHAYHSALMEPVLPAFARDLAAFRGATPSRRFVSSVTGARAGTELAAADYWVRQVREPVRFGEGIRSLRAAECTLFVEIGPGRVLAALGSESVSDGIWISSLPAPGGEGEHARLIEALAAVYAHGIDIRWDAVDPEAPRPRVALPTYAWDRQRYWLDADDAEPGAADTRLANGPARARAPGAPPRPAIHPLLHARVQSPVSRREAEFDSELDATTPLAAEHRVRGRAILPATAFVEMALAAVGAARPAATAVSIEECRFERPLVFGAEPCQIRLVLVPGDADTCSFEIYTRDRAGAAADEPRWLRHASGVAAIGDAVAPLVDASLDLDRVRARVTTSVSPETLDARLRARGLELGPSYQVLGDIWQGEGEVLARLTRRAQPEWTLDPALVDGCSALHALLDEQSSALLVQARTGRIVRLAPLEQASWVHAWRDRGRPHVGHLSLLDASGRVVLAIRDQELRPLADEAIDAISDRARDAQVDAPRVYELIWQRDPSESPRPQPAIDVRGLAEQLRPRLHDAIAAPDGQMYRDAERRLDDFSKAAVDDALRTLREASDPSHGAAADLDAARLGVVPRHRALLRRLLTLRDHADAGADARGRDTHAPDAADRVSAPVASIEWDVLRRCAAHLPAVLRGEVDPLTLLFPSHGSSAAALYRDSVPARVMNATMGDAVAALYGAWRAERPLRVLEVGAGSGATTSAVLARLPARCEYWFTDVSPAFVQQARTRLAADDRLRFHAFDLERTAEEQGLPARGFDLIVAANVLHATRSIGRTLLHLRRLLLPGGTLLALENTERHAWVDLIFGLTDGWWLFDGDEDRAAHPLLSADEWTLVLARQGFAHTAVLPDANEAALAGQRLLVASAPIASPRTSAPSDWIVVDDGECLAAGVVARIEQRGHRGTIVRGPDAAHAALVAAGERRIGVIALHTGRDPDDSAREDVPSRAMTDALDALALVRTIESSGRRCPVWFVTRGVHVSPHETAAGEIERRAGSDRGGLGLAHAPVWGLARTLAIESPDLFGGIVDLDPAAPPDAAAADLLRLLLDRESPGEDVVCRGAERFAPRVRPSASIASTTQSRVHVGSGTVLITGGLGALGLATAEFLAERGARHLCLLGRHGVRTDRARTVIANLEARGITVWMAIADVADEQAMRSVIDRLRASEAPLTGVIHAAGTTGYGLLRDTTPAQMIEALRAKVTGAWVLHRLTRDLPIAWFACYSSMVSAWGARGQGPYVAANHFLDVLARHRRAAGLHAIAINWGPLSGGGMVPAEVSRELDRMGVRTTPMQAAVRALDHLLTADLAQAIVVDIDWSRFADIYRARRPVGLFDLLDTSRRARVDVRTNGAGREALVSAMPGQRRELLIDMLRETIGQIVATAAPIDGRTGLFQLGVDSLGAMELRRLLEQRFALALPSTLLFDCPTVEALADFLLDRLGPSDTAATTTHASRAAHRQAHADAPPRGGADINVGDLAIDDLDEQQLTSLLLRKLDDLG